ncbi:hypothetical protein CFE70_004761 [Pyrenophora teres f. teres 0-1]
MSFIPYHNTSHSDRPNIFNTQRRRSMPTLSDDEDNDSLYDSDDGSYRPLWELSGVVYGVLDRRLRMVIWDPLKEVSARVWGLIDVSFFSVNGSIVKQALLISMAFALDNCMVSLVKALEKTSVGLKVAMQRVVEGFLITSVAVSVVGLVDMAGEGGAE